MRTRRGNSEMLTTSEAAQLLNIHPNTLRQWAGKGLLTVYRLGTRGDRRFKREDVATLLKPDNQKSQQPEATPIKVGH
jgi:excisionase family DNA binding protein